jgi:hypothetical protein
MFNSSGRHGLALSLGRKMELQLKAEMAKSDA